MATLESLKKEKEKLLQAIQLAKCEQSKLEGYLAEYQFQLLQENASENQWTAAAFLLKHVSDPMLLVNPITSVTVANKVEQLKTQLSAAEDIMGMKCLKIEKIKEAASTSPSHYKVHCLLLKSEKTFNMELACESLDSDSVELVSISMDDSRYATDLRDFLPVCIKMNSTPLAIQGIAHYANLEERRSSLLKQLVEEFGSDMLLVEHRSKTGLVNIQMFNPTTAKLLLKISWIIVCDLQALKHAYCFTLRTEPSGQWLRNDHKDLLENILEATEMTKELLEHWRQLCQLVVSSKQQKTKRHKEN